MAQATSSRFLHIANGSSATLTMERARIPGTYSIWADPLHDGPVPGGLSDADLLDVRRRHLGPADAPEHDMRLWRAPLERYDTYDELVLWFEHDLFDQLNLIQLLTWIREHLPEQRAVSLICIGSFPGRPDFKGLGELEPHELAPLLDTREPISGGQYDLAGRAWHAFRQATPEALDALCHADTAALPYLGAALTRLLQEYPWTRDGLSRSERRLLTLLDGDAVPLWQAFPKMHEGERDYYVTDLWLAATAEEFSQMRPPLLTVDVPAPNGDILRETATLTHAGRTVLAGGLDRVTACGVDRWIGGVHLQGRESIWRWDDEAGHVVSS